MKKITAYNKIGKKMWYMSDKLHVSKNQRLHSEVLDAVYLTHKKGFTPGEIANFLDMSESGVTNILKQLERNKPSNDVPSVRMLPGVIYNKENDDYTAYVQIHDETLSLGTYENKFQAAFVRYRFDNIEDSPAAKYVKGVCAKLGCSVCYDHGMKHLPMVCKRAKNPDASKPTTETHDEFLTRAKKVVKESLNHD